MNEQTQTPDVEGRVAAERSFFARLSERANDEAGIPPGR